MNLRLHLLTAFGLGLLRPGPGTWGSLPPVLFALLLVWLAGPVWMVDASIALIGLAFAIACVRFGREGEAHFGRKDASEIVADEVAGQSLPLLFLPWRAPVDADAWMWNGSLAATAFLTFRFFDIAKIPPAQQIQRLRGGWGILADDLVAGAYAMLLTQLVAMFVLGRFL